MMLCESFVISLVQSIRLFFASHLSCTVQKQANRALYFFENVSEAAILLALLIFCSSLHTSNTHHCRENGFVVRTSPPKSLKLSAASLVIVFPCLVSWWAGDERWGGGWFSKIGSRRSPIFVSHSPLRFQHRQVWSWAGLFIIASLKVEISTLTWNEMK